MNTDHVAVIESGLKDESSSFGRPCLPDTQLNYWKFVDLTGVFTCNGM